MTHLKVAVRIRPLSPREADTESIVAIESERSVSVTNVKVFGALERLVGDAIKRRANSCVLAYGQSASGKTHTMMGFPHDPGLMPRLCRHIFGYLRDGAIASDPDFNRPEIGVSYLEIYNEKVRDLLAPSSTKADAAPHLKVRQHPKKGPYVQGLSELAVNDPDRLLAVLNEGASHRRIAATSSNPKSSRSHSVFIVSFGGGSKLTLVDLAGSERAGNCSGSRFREGANINKSLVALGNVISALAEDNSVSSRGVRRRFVPYRDSILTWLLRDTLGGSSDTVMIATISPSSACYNETVNTLRFGQRAKLIVSLPVVHEDPREHTIRALRAEIARLRELLLHNPLNKMSAPPADPPEKEPTNKPKSLREKLTPAVNLRQGVPLRRTTSVLASPPAKPPHTPKKATSEELLARKSSLRKDSLETKTKLEKGVATEPSTRVEAKVNSIRRGSAAMKPARSQIVAAVTHRLYAKTKKREVGVDTDDLAEHHANAEPPKELQICSNARLKLKELTKRAMKAARSRTEETQTEMAPVLRVKETATATTDLRIELAETKHAATCTETPLFADKYTDCKLLAGFGEQIARILTLTRSCGTQSDPPFSFTSLANTPNLHLPTPDLISNHNSLEPGMAEKTLEMAKHALYIDHFYTCDSLATETSVQCRAQPLFVVNACANKANIGMQSVCAAEICMVRNTCADYCLNLAPNMPTIARANIVETRGYFDNACVLVSEPLVLKSIMKGTQASADESEPELPDSLDYHLANHAKKVRFHRSERRARSNNGRLFKAMSSFMEEATILMSNLSKQCKSDEYELEVTINDISELWGPADKSEAGCQTGPDSEFVNRYELLLEDSCQRLEEKLNRVEEAPAALNAWSLDDSSLESNVVTYSDYGSLPRRQKRGRRCAPSAFLRQLTNMRQQIVRASREELNDTEIES